MLPNRIEIFASNSDRRKKSRFSNHVIWMTNLLPRTHSTTEFRQKVTCNSLSICLEWLRESNLSGDRWDKNEEEYRQTTSIDSMKHRKYNDLNSLHIIRILYVWCVCIDSSRLETYCSLVHIHIYKRDRCCNMIRPIETNVYDFRYNKTIKTTKRGDESAKRNDRT